MNWMDRLNERAELMGRMLDTLGAMKHVPSGPQSGAALRSAAHRCLNCSHTDACRDWLENHPDGAERALPVCPNAQLFNSWLEN